MIQIINFITDWQELNDKDFTPVPIDNHESLIFDLGNKKFYFTFSNKTLRDKCNSEIPLELLDNFSYVINQENGLTYYKF